MCKWCGGGGRSGQHEHEPGEGVAAAPGGKTARTARDQCGGAQLEHAGSSRPDPVILCELRCGRTVYCDAVLAERFPCPRCGAHANAVKHHTRSHRTVRLCRKYFGCVPCQHRTSYIAGRKAPGLATTHRGIRRLEYQGTFIPCLTTTPCVPHKGDRVRMSGTVVLG
eukprot:3620365-Rhodomonas_salina.2